ncbi:ABC transporter substrate-binding protein [Kaistia dalseonensis]|uniref:Polar amino acid transport system substrate-binding protein n=1 Tax=Kaistia dalseonensis TaxID=410840 RepID=A0ABU0H762_9HYPH|nr:ABC transporter substrate-binding protein [Kaistia dalseonensis]MCX5495546.1 ABC transporter substrate-binding protein [Kaistia dalseonensis]MDQ0438138.1 polar amino acid transport system substrate-binding protein [Kaistia dalseonensis]
MKHYLRHMAGLGLAIGVVAWSAGAMAAEITKSPEVAKSGTLVIANTLDYAPFEYLDADGKQTGIIIELAGEVAKMVDAKLDIQRTPFPSMIPGLAAGRFKIAWETFSANPDRLKQVDFVMFLKAGVAASTTPDLVASFSGDHPLCGKRVGVSAGTASDFLVDKLDAECKTAGLPPIQKSVFNASTDIIQAVLSGRVDARLDDATASSYFEVTSGGKLVVLPTLYDVAPLGMAVAKGDAATQTMMVEALAELFKNGTYQKVLDKYGMGKYAIKEPYLVDSMDKVRND